MNQALAQMSENHSAPREAARAFLKQHPDIWRAWVPEDVADKLSAAL